MTRANAWQTLAERRLRATPAHDLVPLDDLSQEEREALGSACADPDFYGIVRPKDPRLASKSVSHDAALLLLSLREARRVPALLEKMFGEDLTPLARLVADGVVEVEDGELFLTGPGALARWGNGIGNERGNEARRVMRLTREALRCAEGYEGIDAFTLSAKLYRFGTVPGTPELRAKLASDQDLLAYLLPSPADRQVLERHFATLPLAGEGAPWLVFRTPGDAARHGYKLYVSPREARWPPVFRAAFLAMIETGAGQFKLARGGDGACRPDKMVAYFTEKDALLACARRIEDEIRTLGLDPEGAQGVPFTAPIDDAGYLSWGADPPELALMPRAFARQSFRQWLTARVAAAVLQAPRGEAEGVARFVFARLALDGIDTSTWTPASGMWRSVAATEVA